MLDLCQVKYTQSGLIAVYHCITASAPPKLHSLLVSLHCLKTRNPKMWILDSKKNEEKKGEKSKMMKQQQQTLSTHTNYINTGEPKLKNNIHSERERSLRVRSEPHTWWTSPTHKRKEKTKEKQDGIYV